MRNPSVAGRNLPPVKQSHFAMVPKSGVPRSTFTAPSGWKGTFQTGYLIPFFCEEVLPGDVWKGRAEIFARLNTMLFPIMDDARVQSEFFFCPNRLVWNDWVKMMGEQQDPSSSISYLIPQCTSNPGGFAAHSTFDYLGLPTVGQVTAGQNISCNTLPLRAINLIWNEWYRDQNLQNSMFINKTSSGDAIGDFPLLRRNKRHDYFTSCLPWPQKGGVAVPLPLNGMAAVRGIAVNQNAAQSAGNPVASGIPGNFSETPNFGVNIPVNPSGWTANYDPFFSTNDQEGVVAIRMSASVPRIYADLGTAQGSTLNALREAITMQQYLERAARGGTRYVEFLHASFGVTPEDYRLQRPEYIGGGVTPLQTSAIPQTSATSISGSSTPFGGLSAQGAFSGNHGFSYYAKEHGFIIGFISVAAALTYQQGKRRFWDYQTRFDIYDPIFANLGEQAVLQKEIYCTGVPAEDDTVFGYQERWAHYRYRPSYLTGFFRSTTTGNIDEWHLAQQFMSAPVLNSAFIQENPPVSRVLAAGSQADNMQVLADVVFECSVTRAMPVYSVPGLTRF